MASVPATLKWGKKKFDIEVSTTGTAADFKAAVFALTGVPVGRQKLMAKGVWKGTLKDSVNMSELTFKKNQKIMLMGKASAVPTAAAAPDIVFIEDLSKKEAQKMGAVVPAGFKNLGNTCYMNSTLQCLRYVPELRAAISAAAPSDPFTRFLHLAYEGVDAEAESFAPFGFVMALRQAFAQFDEKDARGAHKQQDADELFNSVMMSLSRSCTKPTPTLSIEDMAPKNNAVDALFEVGFETRMKCVESDAEPEVVQTASQRKLRCNIDGGAGAAHQISHMHQGIMLGLDGVIEKHSAILSRNASWSKTQRISRLPKYLAVQYMRFYWKPTPNSRDREGVNCKMMRPVTFPVDNMDVYDFCSENLKKKLKVYRDKYAEEALATKEGKSADESKAGADEAKASDATPAAAAADVDMGDDEDDDDLAAALAMSLEGDTKMEEDASDDSLLGPGIPKEFRGMYELFAVVSHKGRSSSAGHYMGWARASGDDWFCFDDDAVSPCKTEHVKALKGGGDWDMAYILFYRAKE